MPISDILIPERTFLDTESGSKKRVLERASQIIAANSNAADDKEIFQQLIARERLGSTALGHGVALPHSRISGLTEDIGCLIHLPQGIDFDASDGKPVDLVFVLLVPEEATEDHLQRLADLAELFHQENFRQHLRSTENSDSLYQQAITYGGN